MMGKIFLKIGHLAVHIEISDEQHNLPQSNLPLLVLFNWFGSSLKPYRYINRRNSTRVEIL